MKTFRQFNQILVEGNYKSENAYRVLWNRFVNQAEKEIHDQLSNAANVATTDKEQSQEIMSRAAELMRSRIERAKGDSNDPLSFANSASNDYTGGKTDDDEDSYWNQLDANIDVIANAPSEKKMRNAVKNGWIASGTGASSAQLTKQVKRGTAGGPGLTNATQKSDIELSDPNNEKTRIGISHKQGGNTFLATGEPGENRGVGSTAAKRVSKSEIQYRPSKKKKGESPEVYNERQKREKAAVKAQQQQRQRDLEDKIDSFATPLDYRGSDPDQKQGRKAEAQIPINALTRDEPQFARELTQQHATGKGRFKGQTGTAGVAVKVPGITRGVVRHNQGQKTIDIKTGQETITPGASGGRGDGRPMTSRYRTKTAAGSQGPKTGTQGTFRGFSAQADEIRARKERNDKALGPGQ